MRSESERLAKIRSKYGDLKSKRGPLLVEAKPLDHSVAKKMGEFDKEILLNLARSTCLLIFLDLELRVNAIVI